MLSELKYNISVKFNSVSLFVLCPILKKSFYLSFLDVNYIKFRFIAMKMIRKLVVLLFQLYSGRNGIFVENIINNKIKDNNLLAIVKMIVVKTIKTIKIANYWLPRSFLI